jgi:hypothetical protein
MLKFLPSFIIFYLFLFFHINVNVFAKKPAQAADDLENDLLGDLDSLEFEEKGTSANSAQEVKPTVPPASPSSETTEFDDLFSESSDSSNVPKASETSETSATPDNSELKEINDLMANEDLSDDDLLMEKDQSKVDLSKEEEIDDFKSLQEDVGEVFFEEETIKKTESIPMAQPPSSEFDELEKELAEGEVVNSAEKSSEVANKNPIKVFDVGNEEKNLLELAKFVENKIPEKEWSEIAGVTKTERYTVQDGEWLWKISEKLFGSGFYYSKIWSLNPYITNPHQIKPGMVLVFDTGTDIDLPSIKVGEFEEVDLATDKKLKELNGLDLSYFGDEIEADWIKEREQLIKSGIHVQYVSDYTIEDLVKIGELSLNREYEKYEPPRPDISIVEPDEEVYDATGFDRSNRIVFDFKEGFFLNTFVSTNFVQDLGEIDSAKTENIYLGIEDIVYLKFDGNLTVAPGDLFTVYTPEGKISHALSDRKGFRYTVVAQVQTVRRIGAVWEAKIIESSGTVQRKDRLTVYTPKINRILKTFSTRNIEAIMMGAYTNKPFVTTGDVVYLDRGRVDGVEMGNVFEVYSFYDRGTNKRISIDPTYKIGELSVISLSDNFATALVSLSKMDMEIGQLALSKTVEQAARDSRIKNKDNLKDAKELQAMALEELDVELNLEDINDDLLDKADKIELTEDELSELERQERDKSIIKEHERDLKELEKLENEIESAELMLNETKIDEDKFLEQENLNDLEGDLKLPDPNALESLDELEGEFGRKFMDEDLNNKENPYGLTEFDLEEIDELLKTEGL